MYSIIKIARIYLVAASMAEIIPLMFLRVLKRWNIDGNVTKPIASSIIKPVDQIGSKNATIKNVSAIIRVLIGFWLSVAGRNFVSSTRFDVFSGNSLKVVSALRSTFWWIIEQVYSSYEKNEVFAESSLKSNLNQSSLKSALVTETFVDIFWLMKFSILKP